MKIYVENMKRKAYQAEFIERTYKSNADKRRPKEIMNDKECYLKTWQAIK